MGRVEGRRAHDDVRVSVDVLCHRVHDNVGAVVEWVLHVGAHEGVVDDDHDAVLVGDGGDFADVDERQRGVRGRLDADEFGVWADELRNVDFDARAEGYLDVVRQGHLCEVAMRAAVDIGYGHDVRACRKRLQDVGRGGGSRGESERIAGVLERSNSLFKVVSVKRFVLVVYLGNQRLENIPVGVRGTRVLVLANRLANAGLCKCRRQRNLTFPVSQILP